MNNQHKLCNVFKNKQLKPVDRKFIQITVVGKVFTKCVTLGLQKNKVIIQKEKAFNKISIIKVTTFKNVLSRPENVLSRPEKVFNKLK